MELRALTPDDVDLYRPIRLRALSTDPGSFGSTYERESAFDDATWRSRLAGRGDRRGVVFLATQQAAPGAEMQSVGVAGVYHTEDPGVVYLWGMWVAPEARGTGVSRALVEACIGWANAEQGTAIVLDVVRENTPAVTLYRRFGFEPTGRIGGLPDDPSVDEMEMRLPLR